MPINKRYRRYRDATEEKFDIPKKGNEMRKKKNNEKAQKGGKIERKKEMIRDTN